MNSKDLIKRLCTLGTLLAMSFFGCSYAGMITYDKTFYFNNVKAEAKILGGGRVQTWAGTGVETKTDAVYEGKPNVDFIYVHAIPTRTNHDEINGGIPISIVVGKDAASGWVGGPIKKDDKPHDDFNEAEAKITVDPRVAGVGPQVTVRKP